MAEKTRNLTIKVTELQEITIRELFNHSNWEFIEIKQSRKRKRIELSTSQEPNSTATTAGSGDDGGDGDDGDGGGNSGSDDDSTEICPQCFMQPCVATAHSHLHWLGQGQRPSEHNPSVRRGIYRRFFGIISNLGGWNLPRYQQKKRLHSHTDTVVLLQRDIMPECVLGLVRGLYPNPAGQPYMGHMWS